jgi:hypothetical protein
LFRDEIRKWISDHDTPKRDNNSDANRVTKDAQIKPGTAGWASKFSGTCIEQEFVIMDCVYGRDLNTPSASALHETNEQHDQQRQVEENKNP